MENAKRYCQKHPSQAMTLLFTSWVCDECDPPKGSPTHSDSGGRRLGADGRTWVDAQGYLLCAQCGGRASSAAISFFSCREHHINEWEMFVGARVLDVGTDGSAVRYVWNGSLWEYEVLPAGHPDLSSTDNP